MTDIEATIKKAGDLTLIASTKEANNLLANLNSILAELRMDVSELELKADLFRNALEQRENVPLTRSATEWKISAPYLEFKQKAGLLKDVRAVRRLLDRHSELLSSQERFGSRTYDRVI
jgi:hypothetical protein